MMPLPGMEPIRLDHLQFERIDYTGGRRKVKRAIGNGPRHPDSKAHAADLQAAAELVISDTSDRSAALGIDPKLILVVEIGPPVSVEDETDWANAGLRVVDSSSQKKVVAFGSDPQLTEFLARLKAYADGPEGEQKHPPYSSFFDGIDAVRPYGPQDRVGHLLEEAIGDPEHHSLLVDVEVWYPGDTSLADDWVDEISDGVIAGGSEVVDRYVSPSAGICLIRVRASRDVVEALLHVDLVARVELVPGGVPQNTALSQYSADEIGELPTPAPDAPIVGLIDSGVVAEHPLLRDCIAGAVVLSDWLPDGADRTGHGTAIASLIVRGQIEGQIIEEEWEVPPCRVLSVRVLDEQNELPAHRLIENEIEAAVRYLVEQGVRVINLSLGDLGSSYDGNKVPVLAGTLDQLARELNVVFTIPTGTAYPADYASEYGEGFRTGYARDLVESDATRLIDPAPAAIALTVGSVVPPPRHTSLGLRPVGETGWPSPFSRVGEGVAGAIKPELAAVGGTIAQEVGSGDWRLADEMKVLVADGRPDAAGVITFELGTSFAAPLVARIGGALQQSFPTASANLLRALILQSAQEPPNFLQGCVDLAKAEREKLQRRAVGYGTPAMLHSVTSDERNTVLYAQDEIEVDDVHLFALPIPASFFARRRFPRGVTVALCYDPPVRVRRYDYLGSRMAFEMVRGISADAALKLFLDEKAAGHIDARVSRLSEMSPVNRISFDPSKAARSRGANQIGRYVWKQSLQVLDGTGDEFLLAVQNTRRWVAPKSKQRYALAVKFWVDDRLPPIYSEIRSRVPRLRARERLR
ncbi:S8 family peptidase [Streptomyces sp. 11x1]|uniref:S8 family peptidase n=1 Tax=Streptomyces sp. 11x1 TaxID=3038642 RepID=UPI00292DB310|nr:S8 family peptidase [Streptomyces sp. 11x1]WNZ08699.1 S8 family peptidase [Streptomyces sp. 11x1]